VSIERTGDSRKSILNTFPEKDLAKARRCAKRAKKFKGATTNMIVITEKLKENRGFVNKNLAALRDENPKIDFRAGD